MAESNLQHDVGRLAESSPHTERTLLLTTGDPADGVRSIHVDGLLDQAGSVRLLRLIDSRLDTGADDPRGLKGLLVDLSSAEIRGHGAANVLAHAADVCEQRRIELAVIEPPSVSATPSPSGRGRYRVFGSIDEATGVLGRHDAE